jgi:hypothetical protein
MFLTLSNPPTHSLVLDIPVPYLFIYLFICSLFDEAGSNLEYTTLNNMIIQIIGLWDITPCSLKVGTTSPRSGGRSVGMVR